MFVYNIDYKIGDYMNILYIVLIALAVILFLVGFIIGIIQKREHRKKVLFNTNTKAIEVLDDGDSYKPRSIEKPTIISSTLVEENLEDEEEM